MEELIHAVTVTVFNKDAVYQSVANLLHSYAEKIKLRVGYPMPEKNVAIIFLIVELTNDELGALSGKLGQINYVKVKSTTLKI